MRIVIIFLLSLVSFVSWSQDTTYSGSTKRNTIAVRNELVVYNKFRVPKDTISSAANGSVAYLPGGIYYKDTAWKKIAGTSGAATYTLPTASSTVLGGIKVGARLTINPTTGVLDADVQSGGGGGSQTFQQVLTTGSTLSGDNTVTIGTSSNKLRFTTGLLLTDKLVVANDHSNGVATNEFYGTNYMAHLLLAADNTGTLAGTAFTLNSASTNYGWLRWSQGGAFRANTVNFGFNGDGTDGPKYGELTLNSTSTNSYNGMNLNFDMRGGVHPIRYFGRKYGSASFRSVADWNISEDGNTILGSNTEGADGRLQVTGNARITGLVTTTGATGGYQINRRDNNAAAFGLLSVNGNLDFYSHSAGATKMFMTPGGVLKYSSDVSSSYDARSLVDKGYVDGLTGGAPAYTAITSIPAATLVGRYTASTGTGEGITLGAGLSLNSSTGVLTASSTDYAGEDVIIISADYTVPTTSKIYNIIHASGTAHTLTLPTGPSADKIVIYIRNNGLGDLNTSQITWETGSASGSILTGGAKSYKLIYKNADSKWYKIPLF